MPSISTLHIRHSRIQLSSDIHPVNETVSIVLFDEVQHMSSTGYYVPDDDDDDDDVEKAFCSQLRKKTSSRNRVYRSTYMV